MTGPAQANGSETIRRLRVFWSPDGSTSAVITDYKPRLYGTGESRVDIRDKRNFLLASQDYASGGTQGYRIYKAVWTPDSRFLVFSMTSAGGHSPWHSPAHFYDVRRHKFYSVDALVKGGAVTDADFVVSRPASLSVTGREDSRRTLDLHCISGKEREKAQAAEQELWLHLQRRD